MRTRVRFVVALVAVATTVSMSGAVAVTAQRPVVDADTDGAATAPARVDPALRGARGLQDVLVRLSRRPVAQGGSAEVVGRQQQALLDDVVADLGAEELGRVSKVLNGVFLSVDAEDIDELAADPRVVSISRVRNYEKALEETVPYIGATTVQGLDVDGAGVTVAVLDSGVDYTHAALGGAGTVEAYEAAAGVDADAPEADVLDEQFPTAKVVGGYDFVGESWPNTALQPDPDPIDRDGHGTHVADIIAGTLGVAPGASILAVKVCSAVDTACSGVALIQGLDFAMDPNQDDDTSDHVHIVNMSLGSDYGTAFDDDLSLAVDNATQIGALTVAAAGNNGDKPFTAGTPAAAPTALGVAQTAVPSAQIFRIATAEVEPRTFTPVHQPWSPVPAEAIDLPIQYGDGAGTGPTNNLAGCNAFAAGSLTGKVVLVDRGGNCAFTVKAANVSRAGGAAAIIVQNSADPPFEGGAGDDVEDVTVPSFMISQTDGAALKALVGTNVVIDPNDAVSTVGTMASTSSRGPSMGTVLVKPEIGAPGASVSAEVGTGTGTTAFGGTSGATPMIAGAAALLMDAYPDRGPLEIKSNLINTGERSIRDLPESLGGSLVPITRIGGGEVRVDDAYNAPVVAWVDGEPSAALSFGFVEATTTVVLTKTVSVENYLEEEATLPISANFRFENDELSGAVSLELPTEITVPALGTDTFDVSMTIDPSLLGSWTGESGFNGIDPTWLNELEFDGYIEIGAVHMPWHVLPRKVADVAVDENSLTNNGAANAVLEAFALIGESPDLPAAVEGANAPVGDLRYAGYRLFQDEESCGAGSGTIVEFGINTWEPQTHASAPISLAVGIDVDRDGTEDFEAYTFPSDPGGSDFSNLTWITDTDPETDDFPSFYTTHDIQTGNTILTFCASDLGLDDEGIGAVDVTPRAYDWYNRDLFVTDEMDPVTIDFAAQGHVVAGDSEPLATIEVEPSVTTDIVIAEPASASQDIGLLLLQRFGSPVDGLDAIVYVESDAPGQPTVTAGNQQVQVEWAAPASTGTAPLVSYQLQVKQGTGAYTVLADDLAPTTTSYTASGLTNGQSYRFRVVANTFVGASAPSAESAAAVPATLPTAPRNVVGTPGARQITVRWQAPTNTGGLPVSSYRIQMSRNGGAWQTVVASTGSSSRSRVISGLDNGARYRFRIAATTGAGTGPNSTASAAIVPRTVPGAPRGLDATAGKKRVVLEWKAPRSNGGSRITGYRVQMSRNGGDWRNVIANTGDADTKVTVKDLVAGDRYRFRVAAINAAGAGDNSDATDAVRPTS